MSSKGLASCKLVMVFCNVSTPNVKIKICDFNLTKNPRNMLTKSLQGLYNTSREPITFCPFMFSLLYHCSGLKVKKLFKKKKIESQQTKEFHPLWDKNIIVRHPNGGGHELWKGEEISGLSWISSSGMFHESKVLINGGKKASLVCRSPWDLPHHNRLEGRTLDYLVIKTQLIAMILHKKEPPEWIHMSEIVMNGSVIRDVIEMSEEEGWIM